MTNEKTKPVDLARAMWDGPPEGETLESLVDAFRAHVVAAAIARRETQKRTAERLGITREGLYKLRRRYGLPIAPVDKGRPIPADFRGRLVAS